jgi:hypothetical protein
MKYIVVAIIVVLVICFLLAKNSLTSETKSLRLFQILMKNRLSMGVHPDSSEVFFKSLKQYFRDYRWWTLERQAALIEELLQNNKHDIARGDVKTLAECILKFEYYENKLDTSLAETAKRMSNERNGTNYKLGGNLSDDTQIDMKKITVAVDNSFQKTYGKFFKQ